MRCRSLIECVTLALTLATVACSSGDALDCDLLRGANCWKTALAAIRACGGQGPDGGTPPSGTLSADGRTCDYADGRKVLFAQPVSLPLDDTKDYSFTVENGGKACFSYAKVGTSTELSVGGATVRFEGIAPDDAVLTCPDGSVHRGSYKALLACESDYKKLAELLPSTVWQGSQTTLGGLELNGAGPDSPVTLFLCTR